MTAGAPCTSRHATVIRYPGHVTGTRVSLACALPATHVAEDGAAKARRDERILKGESSAGMAGMFPVGAPVHADGAGYRWTDPEWLD